jgi:hypothetical protein
MSAHHLAAYRLLGQACALLDTAGDEFIGDHVRDAMDPLWWLMTDAELAEVRVDGWDEPECAPEADQ